MRLFPKKKAHTIGTSPGSLIFTGVRHLDDPHISIIDYASNNTDEKRMTSVTEAFPYRDKPSVSWINVDGLHDVELIGQLGEFFSIHSLVLEDILNTQHRPKFEDHETYIFLTLKMLHFDVEKRIVQAEQISFVLGQNYLLSFQERTGDVFESVRTRIREHRKRLHNSKADYLLYCLIDAIVDHYYLVLEQIGETIEQLEDEAITNPTEEILSSIQTIKHDLVALRQAVWPLREVINDLLHEDASLLEQSTLLYLRDVYDHVIQVMDTLDGFRDMVAGLFDLYRSAMDQKSNDVMKLLTIIATIFIPLTFIAGIYGMNFNPEVSPWNMPELNWVWGYPAVWGVMVAMTIGMVFYFKRKGWF